MTPYRTRFAPSPTGFLHIGGVRTALFAWLLARQTDGQFVLRLEDTDRSREVSGAADHIMTSLRALGLNYDEGPDVGGPYGPYRQSERLTIYQSWAERILKAGRAYADPYSTDQLAQFRQAAEANHTPFLFRHHRPTDLPKWQAGQPLRFLSEPKDYSWHDAVMGDLTTPQSVVDDFILLKADGYPTYNFAHIVDDAEMKISHVIRGQEFLPSVPNYLNLYEALGLDAPVMATMPHILGPTGTKKLSKRDGAKDVLDYLTDGYLKDALINFIALLGWNDGTEQEIFSLKELIEKFKLEQVQRSGARFDTDRLNWMNGQYIRNLPLNELLKQVETFWPEEAANFDGPYKTEVLELVQERLKFFGELAGLSRFFFSDLPVDPELIASHKQLNKLSPEELKSLLEVGLKKLEQTDFSEEQLTAALNQLLDKTNQSPSVLFSLIRIATTEAPASPGLAPTLAVLGKDRSIRRIKQLLESLS